MNASDLHFLPLGGTGEIGMNLNLYHHDGRWLMVDCGVMFDREGLHDTFAWMPDIRFIEARKSTLDGLVLTHAHQDHIGAVAKLWRALRCTVYATRFCAAMLREALSEAGLAHRVPLKIIEEDARFKVGPFDLQRIPLTHSIVEMGALVIRTPAGTVLHTGDFKLDTNPLLGLALDKPALRALSNEPIHAVIGDSTNADSPGWTPSEGSLVKPLRDVIAAAPARVAVTFFASNVARLHTLCLIAAELGRHPVPMGRSITKTIACAKAAGYLHDLPDIVPPRDYGFLPPDKVMLLCTGSQGESRAALSRIATGQRRDVYLEANDTVVFSARQIPGNELFVERIQRILREKGIHIVSPEHAAIHASGHPCAEEIRQLYDWVQPLTVIPTHGTPPKLEAHARLAESMEIPALRASNGDLIRIGPDGCKRIDTVPTGRIRRLERDQRKRR